MNTAGQLPVAPGESVDVSTFARRSLTFALAALGFCLPLSVSGVGIAQVAVLLVLAAAVTTAWRLQLWREPLVTVGFALFAWIAMRTLLASALTSASWSAIQQYHNLLMVPFLWAAFRLSGGRKLFLYSLTAGAVLVAVIYWWGFLVVDHTQSAGSPHWLGCSGAGLLEFMGRRRISAGFILALCAFLLFEQTRIMGRRRWLGYSVTGLLVLTVFFPIAGRTGHVTMLLLIACAAWRCAPPRWRWGAALAVPCACALVAAFSPSVQKRLHETRIEIRQYALGANFDNSSTGIRMELLRNGWLLAQRHILSGVGFANYSQEHHKLTSERYATDRTRDLDGADRPWTYASHPHSEYLLQAVGGGFAALGLFVTWLILPMARAARTRSPEAGSLACIALAFAVACVFNSLLHDFLESHVYTAILAWLLAGAAATPTGSHGDRPTCSREPDQRQGTEAREATPCAASEMV